MVEGSLRLAKVTTGTEVQYYPSYTASTIDPTAKTVISNIYAIQETPVISEEAYENFLRISNMVYTNGSARG